MILLAAVRDAFIASYWSMLPRK